MNDTKYFLLTPSLEIKEYDSIDNILNQHPYAIIKEVFIRNHTTNYGNKYPIYHYFYLNSSGEEAPLDIEGWTVFDSTISFHRGLDFDNQWSGFYFYENIRAQQTLVGVANTYRIADTFGEVKEVIISDKEDLMINLNIYRKFRSWAEVEQFKINSQLQIRIEELQEENTELQEELEKLKEQASE